MRFRWSIEGDTYLPHSVPEWRAESAEGSIEAEGAGEALAMMVSGLGAPLNDTIPWDLISQDRPITIRIWPASAEPVVRDTAPAEIDDLADGGEPL